MASSSNDVDLSMNLLLDNDTYRKLSEFVQCKGSLSELARKTDKHRKVSVYEAGRQFHSLGLEYLRNSNDSAEKISKLEDEIKILIEKVFKLERDSLVRSEADAKAMLDLKSECEKVTEQARNTACSLMNARSEIEKLKLDLTESIARQESEVLKCGELKERLMKAETEVELQLGITQQMSADVRDSERKADESAQRSFDQHMENIKTGVDLKKCESEKRKLERKLGSFSLSTPTSSRSSIIGATPKRARPRIFGTPSSSKMERIAFGYLGRKQKRVRAKGAIDEIDRVVSALLDPTIDRSEGADLFHLTEGDRLHLSTHYLELLQVIERNWKNHPCVGALEEWKANGKKKLNSWETVSIAARCDMSQNQLRNVKKALKDAGAIDPFQSVREIGYLRDILDVGRQLVGSHIESKGRKIPTMGVAPEKMRPVLAALCRDLYDARILKGDTVRILNIGDGGGGVCKLGFSFADVPNPLSESNLLPYLVFQGSDEWEELRTIARRWAKEINKIKTLTFDLKGESGESESHTVSVEWFAGGDCKYLAATYGLKNASAKDPCPFCYTDKAGKVISNRFIKSIRARSISALKMVIPRRCGLTTAPARTLQSYRADALVGFKSVKGKPLFNIKVQNCVPPGLHAIQGAFDTLIEGVARRMIISEYLVDSGFKPLVKSLESTLSTKEKKKMTKENDLKVMQSALSDVSVSISLLQSKLDGTLLDESTNKSKVVLRCSDRCLISNRSNYVKVCKENRARIKCGLCQQMIHFVCDDIFSPSDRERAKEESRIEYTCKDCDRMGIPIEERLEKVKEKSVEYQKGVERLVRRIKRIGDYLNALRQLKEENGGPPARRLESAVKEAGADRQAWFQKYTGNQVRKVLRSPPDGKKSGAEIICAIFDTDKSPLTPFLFHALTLLGRMQSASAARDLTATEIDQYKKDKDLFFRCLATLEPKCTMRLKLHILDRHVYPFMLKHGTWGRFLEQAIESKHAKWNKKARVYCSSKKQLFVHWKTIMSDMYIQMLYHINPNRDYSEIIAEYKKSKGKWSEKHGERVVRAKDLPEVSDGDSDLDSLNEHPLYDTHEAAFDAPEQSGDEMEID